jgi:hypothetical protein
MSFMQAAGRSLALQKLDFEGANFAVRDSAAGRAVFNPQNPNGRYTLDLLGAVIATPDELVCMN